MGECQLCNLSFLTDRHRVEVGDDLREALVRITNVNRVCERDEHKCLPIQELRRKLAETITT